MISPHSIQENVITYLATDSNETGFSCPWNVTISGWFLPPTDQMRTVQSSPPLASTFDP